ncbi:MAG: polysaccharide biosynthesis/export family protein [Bacteroidota bacterium]
MRKFYYWLIIIPLIISSCTSQKQLRYFNDLPDSAVVHLPSLKQQPRYIQEGDRLQIEIGGSDPTAAALYNNYGGIGSPNSTGGGGGGAGGQNLETAGFLVDLDGMLEIAYLGKVKASGLTAAQLKELLETKLKPSLKGAVASVRFIQLKFTVLGEVRTPGTYVLPMQRTTFLDALGAAGDLPNTAKRHEIRVYRDYNGQRTIFKVDLRKMDLLNDPDVFQIRHNDVIYVQQRDSRLFSDETRFYISMLTLAIGLYAIFVRNK